MRYDIRDMKTEEYPILEDFLYEAIFQKDGLPPLPRSVIREPSLRAYIEDFGTRKGDLCLCATKHDVVIGAVWIRFMQGFGRVDENIPELAIAVRRPYRGQGAGTALMLAMLNRLEKEGFPAVSLSVQKENPAFRLYRRLGFRSVRESRDECVLLRLFTAAPDNERPGPCAVGGSRENSQTQNLRALPPTPEENRLNFFERVYDIVRAVPPGEVVSYGQVAFLAGNPRMARQVGWALHTCPADVPWHRVVRKDGTLPSFPGEGADRQRSLLLQEGVLFDENGRVERLHFGEPSDDTKSRMKSSRRRLSKHGESI